MDIISLYYLMLYNIIFVTLYFIVHLNIIIKLTWGESHYTLLWTDVVFLPCLHVLCNF